MTANPPTSFEDVNVYIREHPRWNPKDLLKIADRFVDANRNPRDSPNLLRNEEADDMRSCVFVLDTIRTKGGASTNILTNLQTRMLEILKILLRKDRNRSTIEESGVAAVVRSLAVTPRSADVAREAANALLNCCYDSTNVAFVVKHRGVKLLLDTLQSPLAASDGDLLASAAGALQSICFQTKGRDRMRELGSSAIFVDLLDITTKKGRREKVLSRVVGVLHNMSADVLSAAEIRKSGGVPQLIDQLRSTSLSVRVSASGALQHLARDAEALSIMRKTAHCIPSLAQMACADDADAQASAVGALLSIVCAERTTGESASSEKCASTSGGGDVADGRSERRRAALKKILSQCVVLGSAFDAIFDDETGRGQ